MEQNMVVEDQLGSDKVKCVNRSCFYNILRYISYSTNTIQCYFNTTQYFCSTTSITCIARDLSPSLQIQKYPSHS